MSDKKKTKQKPGRMLGNNIYMLRFVAKHTPDFLFWMAAEGIIWGMIHSFTSVIFIKMLFDSLGSGESFGKTAAVIGMMAAFSLITYFFHVWYWNTYNPKAHQRLHLKMQKALFEKARSLDLACYDDPKFYNDFVWAVNESDRRVGAIMEDLGKLINRVIATFTIIGVLLTVDVTVVLLILAFVGISAVFNLIKQRITLKKREKSLPQERKSSYVGRVFRLPDFAKEVRLSNVSEIMFDKYEEAMASREEIEREYNKKFFTINVFESTLEQVCCSAGINAILLFKLMVKKTILLGDFAAANNAVWKLYWQINSLVEYLLKFPEHSLYTEKFRIFMEYEPKVKGGEITPDGFCKLEFKNVDFSYGDNQKDVLHNINLTINKGEKVAIVGYNGAGKSTLIKLIMHLYDPTKGEILLNGRDIREYDINKYRGMMGAVFQDYRIFAATIGENVIGDRVTDDKRKRIETALGESGFSDKLSTLKNGIDTVLTREFSSEGVELSGGEGQKVAIARAFAHDYDLIIMDEPSSALDPMAEYELNKTIMSYTKDKTVIFISHRLSTTCMADRIIMFDSGCVIEEGSHAELMEKKGKYAEMFTLQAEKYQNSNQSVASKT